MEKKRARGDRFAFVHVLMVGDQHRRAAICRQTAPLANANLELQIKLTHAIRHSNHRPVRLYLFSGFGSHSVRREPCVMHPRTTVLAGRHQGPPPRAREGAPVKLARLLAAALDVATIAAIGYTAVAIVCSARFGRRDVEREVETDSVDHLPPVTLLVPLHGEERDLEENLRAFALQDYPVCQIDPGRRARRRSRAANRAAGRGGASRSEHRDQRGRSSRRTEPQNRERPFDDAPRAPRGVDPRRQRHPRRCRPTSVP